MVYMSGSKNARYSSSLINRTNVCGGPKKAGIASRIGLFMQSNPNLIGAPQSVPKTCVVSKVIQTQKYGYRATHGGNMG
jgi:hypothetical protein